MGEGRGVGGGRGGGEGGLSSAGVSSVQFDDDRLRCLLEASLYMMQGW